MRILRWVGIFGKCKKAQIEVLQAPGGFRVPFGSPECSKKQKSAIARKMGKSKNDNSGYGNTMRNTFARLVNALSGIEMDKITVVKLMGVGEIVSSGGRNGKCAK